MIGQVVNYRYEILEKCGDGNFFSVYKARDKVLNRLLAVKILTPHYAQNREFAERVVGEAQSLTDLSHPNIGRILESDSQGDTHFIAVEYVRGINLKDRIRRTAPFAVSYAVDIAIAITNALEYAHKEGIVHGDVRPHNVLISPEGQIKLTDFGMAKALAAFPNIREATILRSVHYMAPEVIRGETPQPSSDIYSLAVMLYEMLTGAVPYDGPTSTAIAARQLQDPVPSPQVLNSGVPGALNEIVMKAMHKDPAQRFSSAAEFAEALSKIREWLRTGQTSSLQTKGKKPVDNKELIYEPAAQSESIFKTAAIVALGVMVVAIVTGVLAVKFMGPGRPELPVPDLLGKTIERAQEAADRTGLEIRDIKQEYNDEYAAGQIFMQDPRPGGTVPKDEPFIRVWVSKGPKLIPVPDLSGLRQSEAARRLVDAGFTLGQMSPEYHDSVPVEHVIRQRPVAGQKLEPGKPIDLIVSLGAKSEEDEPIFDDEETTTEPDETVSTDSEPKAREFKITASVPSNAQESQVVRIVVLDDYGETEAYNEPHVPGARISRNVRTFGNDVEIKVYVGEKMVKHVIYSGNRLVQDRSY